MNVTLPALFLACSAAWTLLLLWTARRFGSPRAAARSAIFAVLWLGWYCLIGATGAVTRFPARPMMLLILLPVIALSFLLARTRLGSRLAEAVPLRLLIGLQVFRIGVEVFLHVLYLQGLVPRDMTFHGRNLDILTGASALLIALWMGRSEVSRRVLFLWNLAGTALLVNVVVIAALSAPGLLQKLNFDAPNVAVTRFPYVLLAGLFVASASALHALTFRKLRLSAATSLSARQ